MVTDDFAGSGALSGNWTQANIGGTGLSMVRASGVAQASAIEASNDVNAYWSGAGITLDDQYAQVTVTGQDPPNSYYNELLVRASGSNATFAGYQLAFNGAQFFLSKFIAGAGSTIASGALTVAVNDVVKLEIIDNIITFYINGIQTNAPVADSDITTGRPGIGAYNNPGAVTANIDNFEADDIVLPQDWEFVQSNAEVRNTVAAPWVVSFSAPLTVGNTAFVLVTYRTNGSPVTTIAVIDDGGNEYTRDAHGAIVESGFFAYMDLFSAPIENIAEDVTISFTGTNPEIGSFAIAEYSGLDNDNLLDVEASAGANSVGPPFSGNTAATGMDNQLVIGGLGLAINAVNQTSWFALGYVQRAFVSTFGISTIWLGDKNSPTSGSIQSITGGGDPFAGSEPWGAVAAVYNVVSEPPPPVPTVGVSYMRALMQGVPHTAIDSAVTTAVTGTPFALPFKTTPLLNILAVPTGSVSAFSYDIQGSTDNVTFVTIAAAVTTQPLLTALKQSCSYPIIRINQVSRTGGTSNAIVVTLSQS